MSDWEIIIAFVCGRRGWFPVLFEDLDAMRRDYPQTIAFLLERV